MCSDIKCIALKNTDCCETFHFIMLSFHFSISYLINHDTLHAKMPTSFPFILKLKNMQLHIYSWHTEHCQHRKRKRRKCNNSNFHRLPGVTKIERWRELCKPIKCFHILRLVCKIIYVIDPLKAIYSQISNSTWNNKIFAQTDK